MAAGATVATGSVRRRRQVGRARPDLRFEELRGNIQTRLTKIPVDGAIVMAVAALEILDLTDQIAEILDPAEFVPAVGQGCVAVECRADDGEVAAALAGIDHATTRREVEIERAFLAELGSGCSLPVGAYVDGLKLHTFLAGEDSGIIVSETIELTGETGTGHRDRPPGGARRPRRRVGRVMAAPSELPLRGRTIVTTRDQPGALDALLARAGRRRRARCR